MKRILINKLIILLIILINTNVFAKEYFIKGNKFTDDSIVLSLFDNIPNADDETISNYILKQLIDSGLFKSVEVSFNKNNFYIEIDEYSPINNFFYSNNERLKDEEIDNIINELEIFTLSETQINLLIEELNKIYQSFGFNNIQIEYNSELLSNNSANVYLEFIEGEITKIKNINLSGNESFNAEIILSKIQSKTKKITNIFANNNFKLFLINNDSIRIKNFYKSQGYKDVKVDFNIEYFEDNKVEIFFFINEGKKYIFSDLKIENDFNQNTNLNNQLDVLLENNKLKKTNYSTKKIDDFELDIANILENNGIEYFEITSFQKIIDNKADLLFKITPTNPVYVNQINIFGNKRTYDYVFRRELNISEGDPINNTKIKKINKKLNNLKFVGDVKVETTQIDDDKKNIDIIVNETQTGSFNVGLSVGTLDGASFVTGLKENNINGTGRSLEFLVNTNNNNKEFKLSTSDKFNYSNEIEHGYSINYKEKDFSQSQSYKLNTFSLDTNFNYTLSDNLFHKVAFGYTLKDYQVTNSITASDNIKKSQGESISFNIFNTLTLNTLNSYIKPTKGYYLSFDNYIETPSSSFNGFIKNVITGKRYYEYSENIISIQSRLGNVISINDNEIISDEKFSLGGRWLRGFDNFGVGPRNSRTAYVGGNNLAALKIDFSKPITLNSQNPIYLNLFNDYGSVWDNKNAVTFSDNDLRVSYGFGINYYSPIGPIGFTWGFPLIDKDYDIKRMFTFSIGNLN